jgi:CysZ protein
VSFSVGLSSAAGGVGRLVATPSLWAWSIAPVVVSSAVLGALGAMSYSWLHDRIRAWAEETLGGSLATSIAFGVLFWVAFAAFLYVAFGGIVRVVAAPFLALLADRTVAHLIGRPSPAGPGAPLVRWVLRPVGEALVVLAIRAGVTLLALPLLFVPVAGTFIFSAVMMALLGLDLIDIAQSARGVLLPERLRFFRRHFGACFGLGVGTGLLMLVPCVNVLLLPAIVVAGVLLDSRIAPDFPRAAA